MHVPVTRSAVGAQTYPGAQSSVDAQLVVQTGAFAERSHRKGAHERSVVQVPSARAPLSFEQVMQESIASQAASQQIPSTQKPVGQSRGESQLVVQAGVSAKTSQRKGAQERTTLQAPSAAAPLMRAQALQESVASHAASQQTPSMQE